MNDAQARVQDALNKLINDVDKSSLRKLQVINNVLDISRLTFMET